MTAEATGKKRSQRIIAYHPFLFSVYPVLFLFARNIDELGIADLVRPIIAVVVLAFVTLTLTHIVVGRREKASLIASVLLLMVFMYGHVLEGVRGKTLAGYVVGKGAVIMPLWVLTTVAVVVFVWRAKDELLAVSRLANSLSLLLVILQLSQICVAYAKPGRSTSYLWNHYVERSLSGTGALRLADNNEMPDIYYIVLDEYAREDAIRTYFGYDNSSFVDFLSKKGFYVADGSTSNYITTYSSLSSSLNLDHISRLAEDAGVVVNQRLYGCMIQDARVIHLLKRAGYKFVFFPSGFCMTNRNPNADVTMAGSGLRLSEFERVLFDTTMARHLNPAYRNYRDNILYAFEALPRVAEMKEPTFTFAHITMPHRPYLFDRQGKPLPTRFVHKTAMTKDEYTDLYLGQLVYLNQRMRTVITDILAKSDTPPIIIVQGDHGMKMSVEGGASPSDELKKCILNAYYLPRDGKKLLYSTISPVNTFRIVFNLYLGGDFDLVDDHSYKGVMKGGKAVFRRIP